MCGGFNSIRDAIESAASLAGNYLLPGSSLLTDNLVSKGSQQQLNSPLGEIAQFASGAAGGGLGSSFTGIPASIGGNLESSALSSFADNTGLSSLFGGNPDSATDLTNTYNGIQNTPGSADTASQALAAPGASQQSITGVLPGSSALSPSGGGISGGGFDVGSIGGGDSLPSSSGIGASNVSIGPLDTGSSGQIGGLPGSTSADFGNSTSNIIPNGVNNPNVSIGALNTGGSDQIGGIPGAQSAQINNGGLLDSITGGSTYNPSGSSGNMGILSSLFGGNSSGGTGGSSNMTNGLLKAGAGYLLNNPNTAGQQAITNASNQAASYYQPYQAAGTGAENTLSNLYGNNGAAAQTAAQQNFSNTPGYQFALNQGINALNANNAATGQVLSGNAQEGINNYAQGVASQQYNNYVNQLQNLASGGVNAAGGAGSALLTGAGAKAQLGQNNANNQNNAIGTGLNALFPTSINLSQLFGGGGNSNGLSSIYG